MTGLKAFSSSLDMLWQSVYFKITSFLAWCVGVHLPMCWNKFCFFKILVLLKKNMSLRENINMLQHKYCLIPWQWHILCPSHSFWELSLLFSGAVLVLLRLPYTNDLQTPRNKFQESHLCWKNFGVVRQEKVTKLLPYYNSPYLVSIAACSN